MIGMRVAFSCVFGFFLSVVLTFQSNLDKMETYAELYNITSFESHSYLLVFDKLREYFFDPNALIKKEIETTLKGIYTYQKEESLKFDADKLPGKYKHIYQDIHKNNLCSFTGDLFSNPTTGNLLHNLNCSSFTGNTSEYGIDVLVSYYIEECRIQKYFFDVQLNTLNTSNQTFNNFLYGTST